jgi:uncharacterized GH25 family protein
LIKPMVVTVALLAPLLAQAHTFVVKPAEARVAAGEPVQLAVLMTERLFSSERLLKVDEVEVRVLADGKRSVVELKADSADKTLEGEIRAPAGTLLVMAKAAPRYRAIEKGEQTQDPAKTLRIEAFSKALVNLKRGDPGFAATSGDRLEVVALDNPAELKGAGSLRVQVLFDGKPLVGKVQALSPDRPRVVAETDAQGIASLALEGAGFWVVRSSHHVDETDARSRRYEASANLLFAIE